MPLKSVLQHVTIDGKVDPDKCKQMKAWLGRLRDEHEWYPITCVRLQPEGVMVVLANNSDGHIFAADDLLCVPANKVGHWTINGKSECKTNYECKRSLVCACTHQEYMRMSKAVKEAHPDGSAKCVFRTCWYPTSCPERNDMDAPDYNIDMNTRSYVNLALLVEALKLTTVTNSSGYEIHGDSALILRISRYTMNPMGSHIGYEEYEGTLDILEARGSENRSTHMSNASSHALSMHDWSGWVVDIDSLNTRVINAPEKEICACESGDCDCPEGKHVCNEDECQCELYMGADKDFAYDEIEHMLHEALDVPLHWAFDRNNRMWRIVHRRTDEIVWEPCISSIPAPLV